MTIPSKLKIGAHTYTVIQAPCWEGQGDSDLGQTDYEKQTIHLKSGVAETTLLSTFIHEIFHVMNPQLDHVILESLSEQFTQVLLDNHLTNEV